MVRVVLLKGCSDDSRPLICRLLCQRVAVEEAETSRVTQRARSHAPSSPVALIIPLWKRSLEADRTLVIHVWRITKSNE